MSRSALRTTLPFLVATFLACMFTSGVAAAASMVSFAPGTETATIAGMTIEDFEDVNLVPGLTIVLSTWRDISNNVTAAPAVTYAGTLATTWTPSSFGFPDNAWDGTHAFVNGTGFAWAYPFAASLEFRFATPVSAVGFGLSNFQHDGSSANTFHTVSVNGTGIGTLEGLAHWVSSAVGKNLYLLVTGDAITSITITADTHFDGMIIDKMAIGAAAVPDNATSWGQVKALYR